MATVKTYIGSGKPSKFNSVIVSIRMEDAQPFITETDSGKWLSFIVSERKDQVEGKPTHSAFVLANQASEPAPATEPKAKAPRKRATKKAKA